MKGYGIRGKLVSGSGNIADPSSTADIIIRAKGGTMYTASTPAVAYAYTSNTFLAVWSETFHSIPLNKDILGQLLDKNGVLQGGQIMISDDTGNGYHRKKPVVTYNGHANCFLVMFICIMMAVKFGILMDSRWMEMAIFEMLFFRSNIVL